MSPVLVSNCCEAPPELMQVGGENYVRCSACHKYIGHVVDRQLALLDSLFDTHIKKAAAKKGIDITDDNKYDYYDAYVTALLAYAPHAAWKAVTGSK